MNLHVTLQIELVSELLSTRVTLPTFRLTVAPYVSEIRVVSGESFVTCRAGVLQRTMNSVVIYQFFSTREHFVTIQTLTRFRWSTLLLCFTTRYSVRFRSHFSRADGHGHCEACWTEKPVAQTGFLLLVIANSFQEEPGGRALTLT